MPLNATVDFIGNKIRKILIYRNKKEQHLY